MLPSEYEEVRLMLEPQLALVKKLKKNSPVYEREVRKFIEFLVTVKGHAWCMDVQSERRKMAKLIVGALRDLRI